ncbi:DEKNAAC104276 [Brettanomyces naardenensis]|uniref:DEKNAAC104276 n=1 Tax=Brettanomyces naardenensis TaxID=13370 RepID=A0A448YQ20_BRENA|nr:DEKNAAC104276 [Brettanomyces naardenensis]
MFGLSRIGTDISTSVKKACSSAETAPKRKHVRACILYTWDSKSSRPFWESIKLLPIQDNEIQVFKALITMHKVCQEGHPSALVGGYRNIPWIESLGRYRGNESPYGRLIHAYAAYLVQKLRFHHDHRGFNGTFEYKEYVSLTAVSDPNEGYQNILDLEDLQDSLDDFGKLVLAAATHNHGNECMVSALVPQIAESYGIYKFQVSMLRAMYRSSDAPEALEPLKERFLGQYHRLYDFYADCSAIRYLTSLITIPRLPFEPPNLTAADDEDGPDARNLERSSNDNESSTASPQISTQPTGAVSDAFAQQQRQYEQEQQRLAQQEEAQRLAQQQQLDQQQQYFANQQRQQEEAQKSAQQQLMLDQAQRQAQGRVAELERDLLALRGQHDQDQLMLQSYDQKVQALEGELGNTSASAQQQIASKDEQLQSLQEQVAYWKNKYESLARLYSQLRTEHLNLLAKFKKVQQKAASAQEAIEKREKLEREMKAKNIELADLIKERDRARLQLDRARGGQKDELERLQLEKKDLEDQLASTQRVQSANMASVFEQHNRELEDMRKKLETTGINPSQLNSLQDKLNEKELELEAMQQTMDDTVRDLAEQQKENDSKLDQSLSRLSTLVDAILRSGMKRIQDSVFLLDSPMEAGNQNASPSYISTLIEKCSNCATDFANSFNGYLIDGPKGDVVAVIDTITNFATAVSDIMLSTKGLTRLTQSDDFQDDLVDTARDVAEMAEVFLDGLTKENTGSMTIDQLTERVINGNLDVQEVLQTLLQLVESLVAPGSKVDLDKLKGELSDVVDREMANATASIDAASQHLNELLAKDASASITSIDAEVNRSILGSALAIIESIKLLLSASIASQQEIVSKGKGSHSSNSFYKKNNRWTEGLISAAKAIAYSTNVLIQTADGVLQGKNSNEELIVASREVAASTAQLVAAARVKSDLMSKTEDTLEAASKKVNLACKQLVAKVNELISSKTELDEVDYSKLSVHENKTAEMEQQVEILKLEKALDVARMRLGEIRKFSYRDDDDDESQ